MYQLLAYSFIRKPCSPDIHDSIYGSLFLPDYSTLTAAYPGDSGHGGAYSEPDLTTEIAGNRRVDTRQATTDAVRLSFALNKMYGHNIPKSHSTNSIIGRNTKVYIYQLAGLKSYLTEKYGEPVTVASMAELTGKSGIAMMEVPLVDGSEGSVGLWDGSKMHQISDHSRRAKKVYFWEADG